MADDFPFKCSSCGAQQFRHVREVKAYHDFLGAVCDGCGREVTYEDIKIKVRQITVEELKKALAR